jgi:hypothetical protein
MKMTLKLYKLVKLLRKLSTKMLTLDNKSHKLNSKVRLRKRWLRKLLKRPQLQKRNNKKKKKASAKPSKRS